jgi:hypothetical protein
MCIYTSTRCSICFTFWGRCLYFTFVFFAFSLDVFRFSQDQLTAPLRHIDYGVMQDFLRKNDMWRTVWTVLYCGYLFRQPWNLYRSSRIWKYNYSKTSLIWSKPLSQVSETQIYRSATEKCVQGTHKIEEICTFIAIKLYFKTLICKS